MAQSSLSWRYLSPPVVLPARPIVWENEGGVCSPLLDVPGAMVKTRNGRSLPSVFKLSSSGRDRRGIKTSLFNYAVQSVP